MTDPSVVMQLAANTLAASAVYVLVGSGFGLVLQAGRFFHMAHGAIIVTAPYASLLAVSSGLSPLAGAGVGLVSAALVGAALEIGAYRPLRSRGGSPLALLIVSLGCLIAWENLIAFFFGDDIRTLRRGAVGVGVSILSARLTGIQLASIVIGCIMVCAFGLLLTRTRYGYLVRALGDDPELASFCGVRTDRIILVAVIIASVLGGLGALLVGTDTGFTPELGFDLLLAAVVVVIVGGVGSVRGIVLAAVLIAAIREMCGWYFSTSWRSAATFVVLIVFLLLRPRGIDGIQKARGKD